jgi:gas vesicle protein
MANIGKKILSAFIEIKDDEKKESEKIPEQAPVYKQQPATETRYAVDDKFKQYFEKLFRESNIPGPDYFEFTKMTDAMQNLPDETARYTAAFAGLSVQGLDKQKLVSTAEQYIKLLEADAANFLSTVDAALKEKVHQKKAEADEKNKRIQQLSQEIEALQEKVVALQQEISENEEKI